MIEMLKTMWKSKAEKMDARLVILLLLIFPIIPVFVFPYRAEISEKSRMRMTYISIAWAVIFYTGLSAGIFQDNFKPQETEPSATYTAEETTTTRRTTTAAPRSTTTSKQTTTTAVAETTSAPVTSAEAADSSTEPTTAPTTQTSTETTTATTRATTAPPTEPVYTEPPVIQTQTQVVYRDYLVNTNSGKFHSTGCRTIPDNMGDHWVAYYGTTSDNMRAMGYTPCGTCKPY